jgi:energy-converting hydrogenase A subunit R
VDKRVFITDCEGPISVNDNAFELAGKFIEDGEKFFSIISRYDDILADEIKKPGYNAGDTLKLIVPFLKAYGLSNKKIIEFSKNNVLLIPHAKQTLKFVSKIMPSFIVSTSYKQYIEALCDLTEFPFENTYSTHLDLDSFPLNSEEEKALKNFRQRIMNNPGTENLDEIFWRKIPKMEIGEIIPSVKTVGGEGKKKAVEDILLKNQLNPSQVMYVGDSITDVQPLQFARENHGIAVSFNGNEFALREAEIAVISNNTVITSVMADIFNRFGRNYLIEFIKAYSENPERALENFRLNLELLEKMEKVDKPLTSIITDENRDELTKKSIKFRKKVRGEAIGGLG